MTALLIASCMLITACDKGGSSYSLQSEATGFKQSTNYVPRPIDILWVVDNSGSMQSSQTNMAANFNSFINRFVGQNYDFHMAVIGTDAWRGKYSAATPDYRKFHEDGWINPGTGWVHRFSGVFMIDKNTPDIPGTFDINGRLGIFGSGDERAFESFKDSLSWSGNNVFNFRRTDAYLAIIIVSDEDDGSATTSAFLNNNYSSPNMVPVQTYVDYLDTYAGVIADPDPLVKSEDRKKKYSVNTISIQDNECKALLADSSQRLGIRYADIANKTNGLNLSLCGDFASNLNLISSTVEAAISEIKLDRAPVPGSIVVTVNGIVLPEDPVNGWTYNSTTMILKFHGTGIPAAGADVSITYDPLAPKE